MKYNNRPINNWIWSVIKNKSAVPWVLLILLSFLEREAISVTKRKSPTIIINHLFQECINNEIL